MSDDGDFTDEQLALGISGAPLGKLSGDEYFEARGVSRSEFEALKRFGDYEELSDGTLLRREDKKEFRIYCRDSGWLRSGGYIVIGMKRLGVVIKGTTGGVAEEQEMIEGVKEAVRKAEEAEKLRPER